MKKKTMRFLVTALFVMLQMLPAYGSAGWEPFGLGSVDLRLIAVAPTNSQIVYASTRKSVFRSNSAGASWIAVNTGLPSSGISALAVDPSNSETVYLGTYDDGLYKSINGGESWSQITGWQGSRVYSLAVDRNSTQTVYAACSYGVAKSTDGGASWIVSSDGLSNTVLSLAVDGSDSQTVYAGTSGGVVKSTNGGQSWSPASDGLAQSGTVNALSIDPGNAQVLYAATGSGIYKSTNGGGAWLAAATFPNAYSVAIDPGNSETVYAGGAGSQRILRSQDGGRSWTQLGETVAGRDCWTLAVASGTSRTIFAGTSAGVFSSTDDGASWTSLNKAFPDYSDVQALAIDPRDSQTIYAGAVANGRGAGGGFKTSNGGEYWSRMPGAVVDIRSLAVAPKDNQTVFAATTTVGVLKGTLGGSIWSLDPDSAPAAEVYSVAVDPANDQIIYAGSFNNLYRSTSGGDSWEVLLADTATSCVALAAPGSQTVYAGTSEGVYKSSDSGNSWKSLPMSAPVFALATAGSGQTVYAGTAQGVFKSSDGGDSWSAINDGLPPPAAVLQFPDRYIGALLIDPTDSQTIYAATWYGVYASNNGAPWSRITEGFPELPARTLAIDPTGEVLLAGTAGGGVYRLLLLPKISGTSAGSVTAGYTYRFTPRASNATRFSISSKPYWADFDASTGTLTGTPSNADAGTYADIVISASNRAATVSLPAFSITVQALPLPTITGSAAGTAVAGHPYGFTPTATGATSFTISNPPRWASFNTTSGALTGTPAETEQGSYSGIVICASNRTGAVCLPEFGISVVAPPFPKISGTPPDSVTAGYGYRFTPTATDATRFGISNLPAWASFDTSTGTLSGTPNQGGTYSNIVISASNRTGTATLPAFSITVRPSVITWQHTRGPEGGLVQFVTVDPADHRNLYAGVFHGGLFKSDSSGDTWLSITNADISALAIDPTRSQVIYAGTESNGMLKSSDGGASWTPINNGLTGAHPAPLVSALAIAPGSSEIIYAGLSPGGVFRSSDSGLSWSAKSAGLPEAGAAEIDALLIDGTSSRTVYAVADGRLFKSIDAGESWAGADSGIGNTTVFCAALAPKAGAIYIGTAGGVYKSADGGGSWSAAGTGLTGGVFSIAVDSADNSTLYAESGGAVFKSSNGGDSWRAETTRTNVPHPLSVAVDWANSQTVYLGTQGGVYKSADGGDSWSTLNHGMLRTTIYSMASPDSQTVYAGTDGGLFRSANGGDTWALVNAGMPAAVTYTVAADPGNNGTVYAASGDTVFRSTDGGASWSAANQGLEHAVIYGLTVDGSNSQNLYAVTGQGIFKSSNGGGVWTGINEGLQGESVSIPVVVDPKDNQVIYAGTWTGGIFKSSNGGGTWSAVNSGLTNKYIRSLAIDPNNSRILYAGTSAANGIFKSSDGGGAWSAVNDALPAYAEELVIDPASSRTIYAATNAGVFRSTDGGSSWSTLGTGLRPGKMVTSLVMAPGSSHPIYAGTMSDGVYRTVVAPLTISGTPSTSVTAGQGYSFTPTATGATAFSIANKPSWATFDISTGAVTGTPTNSNAATFPGIVIRASNGAETVALPAFSITVKAETTVPVVATFTVPAQVNSLTVPISGFTISDSNNDVTGYLVTTSSSTPTASASGWTLSAPTSYSLTSTGTKTLYAWGKDAAGNVSAGKSAVVTVDMTKPAITSFQLKAAVNSGTVPVTAFTATDNVAVTEYQVGEGSEPAGDWKKSPPATYLSTQGSGEITLHAWARDAAGNVSLPASAKSTIDTIAPVITTFTAPSLTRSLTFPVTVSAGNDRDVAGYLITLTSDTPSPAAGIWSLQPSSYTAPNSGIKTLYAWAKDAAGNVSSYASATVNIDITAPAVSQFFLGATTRDFVVPVTLTAIDSTGVTGYQITTSTTAPTSWSSAPPTSYTFTSTGTKTLYAWARDAAGNVSAQKSATVIIDRTPPYVSSFAVKTAWNNRSVPVTAFSASDNTAVAGYLITDSSVPPGSGAVWNPSPPGFYAASGAGPITLYAWVRDAAGNVSAYKSATTTIDETAPVVTSFTAPALINSLTVPVTFVAGDNVKVTGYLITTSASIPAGATWSSSPPLTFFSSSSGAKTLYAWAKDAAGNVSNFASIKVTFDPIAPVVTDFSLGGPSNILTVPVILKASDNGTGVAGYQITTSSTAPLSGGAGWNSAPPASYTFTSTGTKTLYAWVKDSAGNVSVSKRASVTVDMTPPYVSAFTVPGASKTQQVTVSSFSGSDNTGVTGYKITESPTPPLASSAGWQSKAPTSYTTAVRNASVTLYAWAKDAAGNVSAYKQATTTVDTEAPRITLTAPLVSKGTIYVAVTATDNIEVTGYVVTLSTTVPTAGSTSWSATPSSVLSSTSGIKTVSAYARDAAGNIASASAKVTVDTTAPTISKFSLAAQQGGVAAAVTLTASDATGVTGYQITTSSTAPAASGGGWSAAAPTSYTFLSAGTKTLYAWVKDGAGNVSYKSATVTIPLP